MRAVVYSADLEALTVIWLAPWALAMLERREVIAFAVHDKCGFEPHTNDEMGSHVHVVRLRGEKLRMGQRARMHQTWILIADDDFALRLRAVFLPGQQSLVRDREHEAEARGVMKVINWLGGERE